MATKMFEMDGPIPGENFTSDTRNYPWHRPPEMTTTDQVIDHIAKNFQREESMAAVVSLMEIGLDIATITDIMLTKGISQGKWAVDLALLVAGPVAHMLVIIAKGYDIPVNLGVKQGFKGPTSVFFKALKKEAKDISKEKQTSISESINTIADASKGFMSAQVPSPQGPSEEESLEDPMMGTPPQEEQPEGPPMPEMGFMSPPTNRMM